MRAKSTTIVFIIMLVLFFILAIIVPKDNEASVMENRPLASAPEFNVANIRAGTFQSDFENYLSDNIGFRSKFINAGTLLERSKGIYIGIGAVKDQVITLPWGNKLVLSQGKIMEVYEKIPETMQLYIDVLNKYSQVFSNEHNMYLLLAPTQIEFDASDYKKLADSQKETIEQVYSSLNGFTCINAYDYLSEHRNEYIYFRTDHHWTQRGAYYAYCALSEAMGVTPLPLDDMTAKKYSGFLGYLFNQANVKEYTQFADDIEYFDFGKNYPITIKEKDNSGKIFSYSNKMYCLPPEYTSANYGLFMGGDFSFIEIETDIKNGRTALIIKDSYANALIPLLTNIYERIIVIDPRSYFGTVKQITAEYDIDDIIFVNYAMITRNEEFITYISKIIE